MQVACRAWPEKPWGGLALRRGLPHAQTRPPDGTALAKERGRATGRGLGGAAPSPPASPQGGSPSPAPRHEMLVGSHSSVCPWPARLGAVRLACRKGRALRAGSTRAPLSTAGMQQHAPCPHRELGSRCPAGTLPANSPSKRGGKVQRTEAVCLARAHRSGSEHARRQPLVLQSVLREPGTGTPSAAATMEQGEAELQFCMNALPFAVPGLGRTLCALCSATFPGPLCLRAAALPVLCTERQHPLVAPADMSSAACSVCCLPSTFSTYVCNGPL